MKIPTVSEIKLIFKRLFKSKYVLNYQFIDTEKNLIEFSAIAPDPNPNNKHGKVVYSYIRNCTTNKKSELGVISSVSYDKDELAIASSKVGKFDGKKWMMTS